MKNRFLTKSLVILFICGSFISCRQQSEDPSIVRLRKYKESLVEAYKHVGLYCATNQIPGLTIAVSIDNELVWADGFGYSNAEFKVKSLPSHKFRIGQVSELVTGLTAAKLYEQGQLQIDKPVSDFLPDSDKIRTSYTIRQLAAHTSGIRPESAPAGTEKINTPEKITASFIHDKLVFEPGQYYGHTELGYDLIGYLIEKVMKCPYPKIAKSTVLDSLKLNSTVADNPYQIFDNKSSNYEENYIGQPIVASQIDLSGKEASTGYLSSVLDMVKMGNAILFPGFLKQETIHLMTTPYKLKSGVNGVYGFGLISSKDSRGEQFYGVRGSVTGGSASLLIYPEEKMVIAIATNINSQTLELPIFEIASIFKKQLHPEAKNETNEVEKKK